MHPLAVVRFWLWTGAHLFLNAFHAFHVVHVSRVQPAQGKLCGTLRPLALAGEPPPRIQFANCVVDVPSMSSRSLPHFLCRGCRVFIEVVPYGCALAASLGALRGTALAAPPRGARFGGTRRNGVAGAPCCGCSGPISPLLVSFSFQPKRTSPFSLCTVILMRSEGTPAATPARRAFSRRVYVVISSISQPQFMFCPS